MIIFHNNEINKLEGIETTLEKSIKAVLSKCEQNIQCFESQISESHENANKLRLQEVNYICQNIRKIVKCLKSKVDLLKNQNVGEITDFEKFKTDMVEIQENIMNLKRSSKIELNKLKNLENDLNDELNLYYNEKVSEWGECLSFASLNFVPPKINTKTSGQCKEVKQFFDFVHQSGGHENGWRKEDHLLFLKLRQKYKKTEDLAIYLHEILPDMSIETIKAHEEWYRHYLNLLSKKKEAINRWKQNKESNKHVNKEHEIVNNKIKFIKDDSSKLREKLMQWKAEKEEKLSAEKELEKQRILEKIEKDRVKRQKQLEMKQIINEWRESKIIFEQTQRQHQKMYEELEKKQRAANANKLIKQFQSMDELHILKMRQIHKKVSKEPKKRVQSVPPVFRDPKRLMQPTVQWAQRVRAVKEPLHGPIPIFAMPKLAIPEWRKSIM